MKLENEHEMIELVARDVAWRVLRAEYPRDPPPYEIFKAAVEEAYAALTIIT
jgi:hypothetical protein